MNRKKYEKILRDNGVVTQAPPFMLSELLRRKGERISKGTWRHNGWKHSTSREINKPQIQKAQQTLKDTLQELLPRNIIIKFRKLKTKKSEKQPEKNRHITYRGTSILIKVDFLFEIIEAEGSSTTFFKC